MFWRIKITGTLLALCMTIATQAQLFKKTISFYGSDKNDLYLLLKEQGYNIKRYSNPESAIRSAPAGTGVFITADHYPEMDGKNRISEALLRTAASRELRLYVEYPSAYPGLDLPGKPLETHLERGVVTTGLFGAGLPRLALLGIHNCYVLPVDAADPLLVLAKVVGVDKAELGLDSTKTYPLLFRKNGVLISTTALSNFRTGRYGPEQPVKTVLSYIIAQLTGNRTPVTGKWPQDVRPMFGRAEPLPENARRNSIQKGVEWFANGRFYVHPSWKADWMKYGGVDGLKPVGPPVSQDKPNGDGSLGIIEGHTSTIYYDGSQQYRYWMRADVQGEASMALAAAGQLLNNADYKTRAINIINFLFKTSNLRAGPKNDPGSPAFGLIGWATTNAGTFYGDDNARAILGALGAAGYLKTDRWDKELAEAIMANFRTTGKQGFRGERLEENDIIKNGWPYYYNRDLEHPSPHFESWMWALYLWLYDKTHYAPLLERTKEAIAITMKDYPDKWKWGSSLQTQRARLILPLAWLVRVEDTPQHRRWLDEMIREMLKYQDESGAIREELGKGKGMFRELKSNNDYGSDEGSLISQNGQKISCMLYTNNFAVFSLHEAALATGNAGYMKAVKRLADFLTRIQVQSSKHKDLDGAWFRAFDYGKWEYWASNSDAGWGAWCTLTGWIQSWIVTTQAQILQQQSFWDVTKNSGMRSTGTAVIDQMMKKP
ncbi:hypothetical protein [Niabella aurantiaca]|uniref:hypothetical protein n=1 Tax=Niabella aurantiaca TaxID=379900 RepID=UPI000592EFB5|nr:hypothetical protein [Niabella aurantiaca]